ncbi:MAG: hypothetical protein A2175_00855 [Candidatus Nealsonbacteria bacterium RBG_13_42_11]|uniref:Uncharacterized protein n=1 Tax=Candidatus Nealsonbacteria bacterium RBG_13_42_11 TaxID=1801663 RepID=A0A1G2DZJ2_9BACT|nr:MAG: hypothetical protein A2175_00855 [Candidatus Nealsonbacteria bacterium RBG_13_42_11]
MGKKVNPKIRNLMPGQYNDLILLLKKRGPLGVDGKVVEYEHGNYLIVTTHNSPEKKISYGPGTKIWQKKEKKQKITGMVGNGKR